MSKPTTQAERLQRIETLFEASSKSQQKTLDMICGELTAIRTQMISDKAELQKTVDADVADLARLKNRGAGILVGVSIAVGAVGVSFADAIKATTKLLVG